MQTFKKATFFLGDQIEAVGIYNPSHNWNGFAVPFFDKETAAQLCQTLETEFYATLTLDGVKYYAVGDSWTWEVEEL
tara:strand:+ start:192 stop:422 length:231 start_codon:yes stop_codon:yes gene_type:complete